MKIYTKTGDDGTTGLFGGERVSKNHPRIEAYGTVDELNAVVGFAATQFGTELSTSSRQWADELVADIQNALFVVGAELATPQGAKPSIPHISDGNVRRLEEAIDQMEADLPPLKNFILPGGTSAAAALHIARTVCRRAERNTIQLGEAVDIAPLIPIYLNRLSDLLFVFARWINAGCAQMDVEWIPEK